MDKAKGERMFAAFEFKAEFLEEISAAKLIELMRRYVEDDVKAEQWELTSDEMEHVLNYTPGADMLTGGTYAEIDTKGEEPDC